ncbi:MAG: branched-chain amino acid ABC transporter permease [Desulfobacteraceae bacterium]
MRENRILLLSVCGVLVILTVLPHFLSSSMLMVFFLSLLWLVLAANYDILGGFLGYIHLAQGAFFGIGAYTATLLLNSAMIQATGPLGLYLVSLIAIILSGLFAAIIAFPLFRLKGLYFAVTTLVLVFLLEALVVNLPDLTSGSYGAFVPRQYCKGTFTGYYLALFLAIISVGINFYLSRSETGLAFIIIREDEEAAASIGLNVSRQKTIAYVLSSLPSAAAGIIFALNSGFIDPQIALGVERSLLPPLMAMLGGTGLVLGPVLGMIIIRAIDVVSFHYLHLPIPSMFFFGIVLMLVALFVPEGLVSSPWVRRVSGALALKLRLRTQEAL